MKVLNLNAHHGPEVLYRCAQNPSKFLEATLENIQTEPIIDKFKNKKEERLFWKGISKRCTEMAGGVLYKEFYEMICDISIK